MFSFRARATWTWWRGWSPSSPSLSRTTTSSLFLIRYTLDSNKCSGFVRIRVRIFKMDSNLHFRIYSSKSQETTVSISKSNWIEFVLNARDVSLELFTRKFCKKELTKYQIQDPAAYPANPISKTGYLFSGHISGIYGRIPVRRPDICLYIQTGWIFCQISGIWPDITFSIRISCLESRPGRRIGCKIYILSLYITSFYPHKAVL